MAYRAYQAYQAIQRAAREADVRSHRRPRRRLPYASWIATSVILTLLGSAAVVGYARLLRPACVGEVRATVIAAPTGATLLQGIARAWDGTAPAVDGRCAAVEIESRDSAVVARALGAYWDVKSAGPPPDVWVPESTVWARAASAVEAAGRVLPDREPSLARTPVVIAMPRPMAAALGWPSAALSWQKLVAEVAADPAGWGRYGHPEWGAFRLGMTDPRTSTAGLLALTAILDPDDDGEVSAGEQAIPARLRQYRAVSARTTDEILLGLAGADRRGPLAALAYVSAFPALERDVAHYNRGNPNVPLVAVYPADGGADADHPYLVLTASWSDPVRAEAARAFLSYARGPAGRRILLRAGLRDPNCVAGAALTGSEAFSARIGPLPRAFPLPESVERAMSTWTALGP